MNNYPRGTKNASRPNIFPFISSSKCFPIWKAVEYEKKENIAISINHFSIYSHKRLQCSIVSRTKIPRFLLPGFPSSSWSTVILPTTGRKRSDPSGFVGAWWPLKRNSTIARSSTDVFAWYVGVDRVRIEVCVRRRYFRRYCALFDVLSDLTHPFLDGDLPAFPNKLAYRDHASDAHSAH